MEKYTHIEIGINHTSVMLFNYREMLNLLKPANEISRPVLFGTE